MKALRLVAKILCVLFGISIVGCCTPWKVATMTGYDNLSGDDKHPGSVAEYTGTTPRFLNAVPVVSILLRDWKRFRYHNINIMYNFKIYRVQAWDLCSDDDCQNCCTRNAKHFGGDFLLDVERRTLEKVFKVKHYEDTMDLVHYQICDAFDPEPIAKEFGLRK